MTPQVPRFIAHEMEHILEQLDGIDLQAQDGNGVVWKSNDTTFETRRAIEAGLQVELEIARAEGRGEPQVKAAPAGASQAIVQRERDGDPLSERTGRLSANSRFVISPLRRICSATRSARPGRPTSTCTGMSSFTTAGRRPPSA